MPGATSDPFVHKAGKGPSAADLTGEGSDDEKAWSRDKATPMETDKPQISADEAKVGGFLVDLGHFINSTFDRFVLCREVVRKMSLN